MIRPTIAYWVSDSGYLAHIKPIIDTLKADFDHVIMTKVKQTSDYARQVLGYKTFYSARDNELWREMYQRKIKTMVAVYQAFKDPQDQSIIAGMTRIQMFHGVSFKSNELHNWHPSRWSYVLVQGRHYWDSYTSRYPDFTDRIIKTSFPRSIYYESNFPDTKQKNILYMPTHRDCDYNGLVHNIKLVCSAFPRRLTVKLHPIILRKDTVMRRINEVKAKFPGVEWIDEDSWRYVNYHSLFYSSSCLISDFSSVVCEYTMMDRPIIILRGNEKGKHVKKGFQHLEDALFKATHKTIRRDVEHAIESFKPGSYPPIYYDDETNFFDFLRKVAKP